MSALPQARAPSNANPLYFEEGVQSFGSPITGSVQRASLFGKWRGRFNYVQLEPDEALPILTFLQNIGLAGNFTVYDPMRAALRGTGGGTPLANSATAQTGKTLVTDGWTGAGNILEIGDLIGIGTNLYTVAAAATQSSGNSTITLANPIRPPGAADNAPILIGTAAVVKMRLVSTVVPDGEPPLIYSFNVEMIEDILG